MPVDVGMPKVVGHDVNDVGQGGGVRGGEEKEEEGGEEWRHLKTQPGHTTRRSS